MGAKKKKSSKKPGSVQTGTQSKSGGIGGVCIAGLAAAMVLLLAVVMYWGMTGGSGQSGRSDNDSEFGLSNNLIKILDLSDKSDEEDDSWLDNVMKLADGHKPIMEQDMTCYGVLNGHVIDPEGNTFESVFPEEDWLYNPDLDNDSPDIIVFNDVYPYLELSLHPLGKSGLYRSTYVDLEENGFVGYQVSCEAGLDCPAMSWAGLTFGASVADIEAVYGEPDTKDEGELFTNVLYRLGDWVLKMFVYNEDIDGTPGLYSVSLTAVSG